MLFPKLKRTKNRKLLDQQHDKPCVACGFPKSDPDHIKSKGSGGPDEDFNLWPLCRTCHICKHRMGMKRFLRSSTMADREFLRLGWEINWETGKITHPKLNKG